MEEGSPTFDTLKIREMVKTLLIYSKRGKKKKNPKNKTNTPPPKPKHHPHEQRAAAR